MSQTVEQLKLEVSEEYIKQFKKELWWMKSLTLLPIEKKVKDIIIWQKELPASFDEVQEFGRRKDIINFVTPSVSNEIFNFMKEKRLLLEQKHTEEELNNLKHQILTGEIIPLVIEDNQWDDNKEKESEQQLSQPWNSSETSSLENSSSEENIIPNTEESQDKKHYGLEAGAVVGSAGVGLGVQDKLQNRRETQKIVDNIETKKMRTTMEKTIEMMKGEISNPRYTDLQRNNISKTMKQFESGLDSFDDNSVWLLKQRWKLWNKLPNSVLKNLTLDAKTLGKLKGIETELVGKSVTEMKAILSAKSITGIPDDVLDVLKNADNIAELKTMTNILSHADQMRSVSKMIKGMFAIDVILFWVDIWMYFETMSEADAIRKINTLRANNKTLQANTQLVIALSSLAIELWIVLTAVQIGAIWGPLGMLIGLVVGAITAAASYGVDTLYFDVQDFYTQNKEDYIRQSKTKIKQAILQHFHNKKFGNTSWNEKIWSSDKNQKQKTLKDSLESLVFLEELEVWSYEDIGLLLEYKQSDKNKTKFVSSLSKEQQKLFRQQDNKMNKKIQSRMEYIQKYYNDNEYITQLRNAKGQEYISQFIVDSGTYSLLKKSGTRNSKNSMLKNRETYKNTKLSTLPKEIINNLDALKKNNPDLFYETWYGAKTYYETVLKNEQQLSESDSLLKTKIEYILSYKEAKDFGVYQWKKNNDIDYTSISFDYVTRLVQNNYLPKNVAPTKIQKSDIKEVFGYANERKNLVTSSPNLTQNIIYRLATELYDYQGENDMMALMTHFSSSNANQYGLYYDNAWYINDDNAVDQRLELGNIDTKEFSDEKLATQIKWILFFNMYTPGLWTFKRKDLIDSPTETIVDAKLSQEFEKKLNAIVLEECSYRTKEHKLKITQSLHNYIKGYASDGSYIELPQYLVQDAMKSGLGDFTSVLCSYRDGKIVLASPEPIKNIHLDNIVIEYLEPVRTSFSHSEQKYINEIEFAHRQLEQIRGIQWTWTQQDDLDIPREIEIEMSKKYKSRQQQKNRLLRLSPLQSQDQLKQAHEYYVNYFQKIYRGIISSRHGFWNTNDIDSLDLFSNVLVYHSTKWIDTKTGKLKKNKEWELLFAPRWVDFEKTYDKVFESYTYKWKKIADYLHSKNPDERKLWVWLSKSIVFTLLEISSLELNDNADIKSFLTTGWSIYLPMITEHKDMEMSKQFYKRLEKNLSQTLMINPIEIENESVSHKNIEDLKLIEVSEKDTKTLKISHALQSHIEKTAKEVVRQGKRGDIIYDPIHHTIESRWHKINFNNMKDNLYRVGNFSKPLSLVSALWLANFANRYKYTYYSSDIEYRNGLSKYPPFWVKWLYSKKTSSLIMSPLTLLKNCPEIKSEKDIWSFVYFINKKI